MSRARTFDAVWSKLKQATQLAIILFYLDIFLDGFLNNSFGFPVGSIILDGAVVLLVCAYLTGARQWQAIGFRRPASWRSLLWFAPLLLPVLESLKGHVYAGLPQTLLFVLLYIVQSLQTEAIVNGIILRDFLSEKRTRYAWYGAITVATLQAALSAVAFALVPPEDGFVPLLLLISISTGASAFASAALRIRTGLLWPLVIIDVLSSISYYVTLPPHPSLYPLTEGRLIFFLADIAFGIVVGLTALLMRRPKTFPAHEPVPATVIPEEVPVRNVLLAAAPQPALSSRRIAFTCLSVVLGVSVIGCSGVALVTGQFGPFQALLRTQDGSQRPYYAVVPSSACDHHGAFWFEDPEESYTCLSNGLLVIQKYFDYAAEDYFAFVSDDDSRVPFAAHSYRVQVTVTVVADIPGTCAEIHTHIQDFQGRQWFSGCNDGTWNIGRCDLHCDTDVTLLSGTLPATIPHNRFVLAVDVGDSVTTFRANGVTIATLRDATYTSTNQIALAMYGPEKAQMLPAVLFSDFSYIPLGGSS